tara:strand:+ start:723 stop:917 length:195 start_codon:yes stop_codon:yes gene_type:complete
MKLIITDKHGNENALEVVKMKVFANAGYIQYGTSEGEFFWNPEIGFATHPLYAWKDERVVRIEV